VEGNGDFITVSFTLLPDPSQTSNDVACFMWRGRYIIANLLGSSINIENIDNCLGRNDGKYTLSLFHHRR
jgi:hypothetical protein